MKFTLTILLACLVATGCTNKELYETIQDDRLSTCKNNSQTYDQFNECDDMYGMSYEKYKETTQ